MKWSVENFAENKLLSCNRRIPSMAFSFMACFVTYHYIENAYVPLSFSPFFPLGVALDMIINT